MNKSGRILLLITIISTSIWLIDSALEAIFFADKTFIDAIFDANFHVPFHRLVIIIIVNWFAVIAYVSRLKKRQLSATLSKKEEIFEFAIKGSKLCIWDWDVEHDRINFDLNQLKDLGFRTEFGQLNYQTWLAMIHEGDRESVRALVKSQLNGQSEYFYTEIRFCFSPEQPVWVGLRGKTIEKRRGRPLRIVGVLSDISERKGSELLLQKQKNDLQTIIDTVPAMIYYKDRHGRFISVNQSFEKATGFSKETWIGKSIRDFYPGLDSKVDAEDHEVLVHGKHLRNIIEDFVNPEGEIIWLQTDKIPHINEQGKIIGIIGLSLDITEKIHAAKAIRDRESRIKAVFNNSSVGICVLQDGRKFIQLNHFLADLFGYDIDEMLDLNLYDIAHRDDTMHIKDEITAFINNDKQFIRLEKRFIKKDKSIIWVDLSISKVMDAEENGLLIGVFVDDTERHIAQDKLEKSERRLKLALESANEGLWDWNIITKEIYLSPRFYTMLGYEPERSIQKVEHLATMLHPEEERIQRKFANHVKSKSTGILEVELRLRARSTLWHWVLSKGKIVEWGEDGKAKRMIGTAVDITDLKLTEEALRYSERQLRLVIQNMPVMMSAFDEKNLFLVWNRECVRVSGYAPEEIVGNPRAFISICPDKEYRKQIIKNLIRMGNNYRNYEIEITCKNGDTRIISLLNISADFPIPSWKSWLIGVDITERSRAEKLIKDERSRLAQHVAQRTAELRHVNSELSKALTSKDEFLTTMSHELRTPLNAVLGLSEALLEEVLGNLNEEQIKALKTIEESGRHLLSLINDILDLSKIGASKLELNFEPVSLELVCQSSIQFVSQMALNKNIKISFDIDDNIALINADQRRLKQIIVNLLSNAVKFTQDGGQVALEAVGDTANDLISIIVRDTGIGIPREKYGSLFQPFVQLDSSLSRGYPGTGLGLALVLRLTELHGGGVNFKSEVGVGSTFTIVLPWKKPEDEEFSDSGYLYDYKSLKIEEFNDSNEVSLANFKQPVVLLTENDPGCIQPIEIYLAKKGFLVHIALNGIDAMNMIDTVRPDIILMDILMPKMDGYETIRNIRRKDEYKSIPIIAITALAMMGDKEKCIEAGANDYLSKPISLNEMLKKINDYL